jgi:hypothetical protein
MARKKRLDKDAEQATVYLTPVEQLVVSVIAGRRKNRKEERTSLSEIVVDGLWKILTEAEGVPKEKIEELLPIHHESPQGTNNLKVFPKT